MAAYAISKYSVEDYSAAAVLAALETQLETLDSTNDPVVLCNILHDTKTGKYIGVLLTS